MTKAPIVSGAATVAALELAGFVHIRTKGSHAKLRHAETGRTAIVPLHRELAVGTLASILRQADLTTDEFRSLVRR